MQVLWKSYTTPVKCMPDLREGKPDIFKVSQVQGFNREGLGKLSELRVKLKSNLSEVQS
jgi:hypothetical protein